MQEAVPQKPKRHRSQKYPATPLVGIIPESELGPAMLGLDERARRFVLELRHGPAGYGSEARAVRAAGYTGNAATLKKRATRLIHDARVQQALREVGYRFIRAAAFQSIRNVEKIANDFEHRDCLKANLALLDRGGFALETVHNVNVTHETKVVVATEKVLERIRILAEQAGIDAKALPPTIDLKAEEVEDADE